SPDKAKEFAGNSCLNRLYFGFFHNDNNFNPLMDTLMNNRRDFIKKSMAGLVAGSVLTVPEAMASRDAENEESFKLGIAGYSFVHFDLEKSLEMMEKVDVKYLCIKDFHLPFDSSDE